MARNRRSFGRRMTSWGNRARTIIRYVKTRTRRRSRRPVSFFKKNKNVLVILSLVALVFMFKDKIKTMLKIA